MCKTPSWQVFMQCKCRKLGLSCTATCFCQGDTTKCDNLVREMSQEDNEYDADSDSDEETSDFEDDWS